MSFPFIKPEACLVTWLVTQKNLLYDIISQFVGLSSVKIFFTQVDKQPNKVARVDTDVPGGPLLSLVPTWCSSGIFNNI